MAHPYTMTIYFVFVSNVENQLEMFLDFVFNFRNGIIERRESCHRFSFLVDDELGEVPLDETAQKSALL